MSAATILTLANGRGIDLLNPRAEEVCFDAFAEHLAKEKRYNGATPGVEYSVAEHACRCSDAALAETCDETVAAYVLLHDHHEAALKDDTTPKKRAIAEIARDKFGVLASEILDSFALLTERHDAAIHEAAGLAWPPPPNIATIIKRFDLILFVTEWRDLMKGVPHPNWAPYSGIKPLPDVIKPWATDVARAGLAHRCRRLLPHFQNSALAHNKTRSEHAGPSA